MRKQRKLLKKLADLLKQVEESLEKNRNKKAVQLLDSVFPSLSGLDVDSNVFRSTIMLKLCRAKANMNQHEAALEHCEEACKVLLTPMPGQFVPRSAMREAREARAEAYMRDKNFDDAVTVSCRTLNY